MTSLVGGVFLFRERGYKMKNIRVPSGLRDFLGGEELARQNMVNQLQNLFCHYGYRKISTPSIEYYSTYQLGYRDAQDEVFYKFFDGDGRILALRSDMTVPIARCASTLSKSEAPYRFTYGEDVYKVNASFAGRRNEVTDCGIERIGGEDGDIEVLWLAAKAMEMIGGEDYVLEVGSAPLFQKAAELSGLNIEQREILADLTDRKSMADLNRFLDGNVSDSQLRTFFKNLPLLNGGIEVLHDVAELACHRALEEECDVLISLYEGLDKLGASKHIAFDPGKIPHLNYYTGIIFEGYRQGVGHSVLSGGRYDELLGRFGNPMGAIGFGVKIDYLPLEAEEENIGTILYPKGMEAEALRLAEKETGSFALRCGDVLEPEVKR